MTYFDETSFLHVVNENYLEELYLRFKEDPGSVDSTWAEFFEDMGDEASSVLNQTRGATWSPRETKVIGNGDPELAIYEADGMPMASTGHPNMAAFSAAMLQAPMPGGAGPDQVRQATLNSIRAIMLIRAYRVRGHLLANLDPLGLEEPTEHPELDPATYGFSEADMDQPIFINYVLGLESATVREILKLLKQTYCGTIGVEFTHISDPEQKAWIQERVEGGRNHTDFTNNGKRAIFDRLAAADVFEGYLDKKFTGTKRFGLDGGESLIPALEQVIKRGGQLGVREIVIGMAHRGRLNVLAQVMGKPFSAIFSEFQGATAHPDDVQGSGDVKYHLGTSSDRTFDGTSVHLSLTANPSHLEVVDPVVLGKVRAKQRQRGDVERHQVMGLILHGDARLRRPRHRRRVLRHVAVERLSDRRNGPFRHQQPNRLHDGASLLALVALLLGRGETGRRADLPRQRRRSRGGHSCGAHGDRVSPEIQMGRRRRHDLLPPSWPQ